MVKDHPDSQTGNLLLPLQGYSFWLAAMDLIYAPFLKQNSTYHGALAGMKNSLRDWTDNPA